MLSLTYLFLLTLAIISTEGTVSMHNPFYCYSEDPLRPQLEMFFVRTGYETHRGQSINRNVSSCNPSKFWMFGRHGARFPLPVDLTFMLQNNERIHSEILSNYARGRTSLCASDFDLLNNWRFDPNLTLEVALDLTLSGWDEMKGQGQRYQSAFPEILSSTYSPNDYFFRTTDSHRTQQSLRAFADGIFGVDGHEQVEFEDIPEEDYLLSAHANCPLYNQVTAIRLEQDEFREGPEYQEMISQISAKLGFHGSHVLRANEVRMLHQICSYEQTWYFNITSPFCAAFSIANQQVFEYYHDVDFYYRNGYGYTEYRRLFENLSCFGMQDMLRFLQSNDPNDHKVRVFNTNNPSFVSIFIALGAFEDDIPLTRHNFAQQTDRLWKTSLISPMGANLAVIRYDCADGDNDILFLYNERPLQIDGCEPNGVCKQSLIMERFGRFLDANCMEVFCSNS